MSARKERLTVTVDSALILAGADAVASGRAPSLSGWVNLALSERVARERRLRALDEAIAMYEAESGAITPEEIAAQAKADRRSAIVVRGGRRVSRAKGRRKVA
jgi:hypothetical protein